MPQWPLPRFPLRHDATVFRSGSGLNAGGITASATPHTKGNWSDGQLIGEQPGTGLVLWTYGSYSGGVDTSTLLDVGTYDFVTNDYSVLIPNIQVGFKDSNFVAIHIPIDLAPNTYLAYRLQSLIPSNVVLVGADVLVGESSSTISSSMKFTSIGSNTATSGGTTVTPNASANTMGSYSQLTASTTSKINEVIMTVQLSGTTQSDASYLIDVAVGGAGSESDFIRRFCIETASVPLFSYRSPQVVPLSFDIPVGSRISARCQSSVGSAEALEIAIIGITH